MYHQWLLLTMVLLSKGALSDINYRLNTPIIPKAYTILITPYFDTGDENAFTFEGEVDITFNTSSVTNQIKLHSEDLNFDFQNVTVSNTVGELALNTTNSIVFDSNYTFVYINLQENLQVDVEYSLQIAYTGPIRTDLNGFYCNYYIQNGDKKWFGATQMEPTHARKVFPCFDEPDLKAKFTLSIDRPNHYKPSLANTKMQSYVPLSNGHVREIFHPTPIMSTYLVAFLISEFDGVTIMNGTHEFGVFTRPEALNQTDYTVDFGLRVVDALGEYFGINYYLTNDNLKLDHVALTNFRAGAMENWGLVTYREALMLYVPEHSTPYYKYRIAQIVAHETTHMWFGNLVTCHWWSNIWLNEGFANYFQDYITSLIEPEVGSANMLVISSVYAAYGADSSPLAPAITNNDVNSPAEISEHFGTVTYQKAGSVIRMMHHLVGDDAFRTGLHTYLDTNKFGSGYPERLYSALNSGVTAHNSLVAYPSFTIADVMNSWISQAGHPVLDVNINYIDNTVTLTQKRYYANSSYTSNETYMIPVTYTTQRSVDFNNTKPAFIMSERTYSFTIANLSENHSWVIFNLQETGLYRVNYDDHSWQIIASALKGSDRERIHNLNRAKIVNDLFALFNADEVDFSHLYNVLDFLSEESDYPVWYATFQGFKALRNKYLGSDALADLDTYILRILQGGINNLGFSVRETDDFETLRCRMELLQFACYLGHGGCLEHMSNLFRGLKDNGTEISPSLRPPAYCSGLTQGNGDDFDFLWARMSTTNVASEARMIGEILGCTNDIQKLNEYLISMSEDDSPIQLQDITMPLYSVLSDYSHVQIVLEALKNNYTYWSTLFSMDTVVRTVASALHTESDFDNFENFLSSCGECSEQVKYSGRYALGQARAVTEWANSHRADILSNLRSFSPILAPSILTIFVGLAAVLARA